MVKKTVKKGGTVIKVLEQAQYEKVDFKSFVSAGELEHADVMDFAPAGKLPSTNEDDDKDLSDEKEKEQTAQREKLRNVFEKQINDETA